MNRHRDLSSNNLVNLPDTIFSAQSNLQELFVMFIFYFTAYAHDSVLDYNYLTELPSALSSVSTLFYLQV